MRILSIWTFDPASKKPPTQDEFEQMGALIAEMQSKGILIDTGGAMDGALEFRYARKNGKDTITDGPFAEAKEVVGGFALIEVPDREEGDRMDAPFPRRRRRRHVRTARSGVV